MKMQLRRHLWLSEQRLPPSTEWGEAAEGWRFLRIVRGNAYWMEKSATHDLGPGDMLVIPPGNLGRLLVSQIGEAVIQHFNFCPQSVSGLLTLRERHHLELLARKAGGGSRSLRAREPAALQFAALCAGGATVNAPFQRCRMLNLIASVFGPEMPVVSEPSGRHAAVCRRFVDSLELLTDAEVAAHSVAELAVLCGCSARHFSRLFRLNFGSSVRAKQTELRLQKAGQMLADSDAKVIYVALESGYRHLGLFNSLFKRHFGMTPSQWRLQQAKGAVASRKGSRSTGLALAAVLAVALGWAGVTSGAQDALVTAARVGVTNSVAVRTNVVATLEVKSYDVIGNTLLPPDVLARTLSPHTGAGLTFADIQAALTGLQMAYRERGFATVAVALPPQKLTNGIVRVQVTEGRLSEISVVGNRYFSSNNIVRALPSLHTNIHLNSLVFQQELERANANRDRQIYPLLTPGGEPGTSTLTLKVKDRLPLHGRMELNNYSPPATPELRLNTSVQYNNLWQLEHQIGLQYSFSPQQYRQVAVLPDFPDQPSVASYSGFYRLPLKIDRSRSDRADYTAADFGYNEVSRRFQAPAYGENPELIFYASRSSQDTGNQLTAETLNPKTVSTNGALQVSDRLFSQTLTVNENFGFRLNAPLPGTGPLRIVWNAGLDFKYYSSQVAQQRIFQATVYVPPDPPGYGPPFIKYPSPPTSNTRVATSLLGYLPVSAGLDISQGGPSGTTALNWNTSVNFPGLFDNSQAFEAIANSTTANGNYCLTTAGLTRDQRVLDWLWLTAHADGQWASQPLINNEQFGLGGQGGPAGYRDGQVYGDCGWRFSLQPHTKSINIGMVDGTIPMLMRFSAFTDYGQAFQLPRMGRTAKLDVPGTYENMWSAGCGISSTIGERWDFRFTGGWALLPVSAVPAGAFRATFSVGLQF